MSMFRELDELPDRELRNAFARSGRHRERDLWMQELATRIAESGTGGVDFLISKATGADESMLRAILLAVSSAREKLKPRQRGRICALATRLLKDRRPLVVAEAVDALAAVSCGTAENKVSTLLEHRSPYVAASALRYLARVHGKGAGQILMQALDSRQPIVRQNAVDELDELNYQAVAEKIGKLLNDPDKDVRQAARTALAHLRAAATKGNGSRAMGAAQTPGRASGANGKHVRMPSAGRHPRRKRKPGRESLD